MFEKVNICPACSHDSFSNHIICKDHFLTGESFAIARCNNCNFLFTNPRPIERNLEKYYRSDAYISHTSKTRNPIDVLYKIARHFTLSWKLNFINRISDSKSILDFGCGTGDFLAKCKSNGWQIRGLEPNADARELACKQTGVEIHSNINQLADIQGISLITMWHVLEHIPNLNETLKALTSKLSRKGKLLIAVPNYRSYDAHIYKEFWAAYDVPRHLYHFSQDSMKLLLRNHGLKILDTIPMKLDAFYVSILSEKYKVGKSRFVRSFINGYKSNIYAKKHYNNYSSLIYIATK